MPLVVDWFHGTEAPYLTRLIVERLREADISCGISTTGGGCMAIEGGLPGGKSFSITDADAGLPGRWSKQTLQQIAYPEYDEDKGEVWLGRYTDEGEADYDTSEPAEQHDESGVTTARGWGWWSTSALRPSDLDDLVAVLRSWGA